MDQDPCSIDRVRVISEHPARNVRKMGPIEDVARCGINSANKPRRFPRPSIRKQDLSKSSRDVRDLLSLFPYVGRDKRKYAPT